MAAKQKQPRRHKSRGDDVGLLPLLRSASAVRHLNYNHLLYFWTVVREGGITRAAEVLHLTPQTISGQLRVLEEQIGGRLFERVGRRLQPTELGRIVQGYADDIFSLGSELARVVRGAPPKGQVQLSVGVADEVPKLIAYRMLEPVVRMTPPARLVCIEGTLDRLLSELAVHRLDVVLSASPLPDGVNVRAYSHLLGECDLAVFGAPALAKRYRTKFPQSLDQAPWLLPTPHSPARRALDQWFDSIGITPAIVGEFDDSALIKAFGEAGVGVFCAPDAIAAEVRRQFRVQLIGRTAEVRPRFYAISIERRIRHPAVAEITSQARTNLLASG
jgi:LysR family transcriptional activator of nhaA